MRQNPRYSCACEDFLAGAISRRHVLKIDSLGLLGLSLPELLDAESVSSRLKPRAKSVLFFHHYGAPSQLETFDPKPEAPENR